MGWTYFEHGMQLKLFTNGTIGTMFGSLAYPRNFARISIVQNGWQSQLRVRTMEMREIRRGYTDIYTRQSCCGQPEVGCRNKLVHIEERNKETRSPQWTRLFKFAELNEINFEGSIELRGTKNLELNDLVHIKETFKDDWSAQLTWLFNSTE